ncbi:MAG: large-conductance mechanosensitive channel protein MscL [Syntrophorhabdaceae bacterium]
MGKDFRDFIMRGNVVDMAVGIIIGAAFVAIVKSLVDDIIMPPIGLVLGNVDFTNLFVVLKTGTIPGPYLTIAQARAAGAVTINYGVFINNIISFLIVAYCVFMLIRGVNKFKKEPAPAEVTTKDCPYCLTPIPVKAVKCAHCTTELK